MNTELFENLRLELRRGSLVLAVLAELRAEHYGYTLCKALGEHGLAMEESTLYPLLYNLSADGTQILQQLLEEWRSINQSLTQIIADDTHADEPQNDLEPEIRTLLEA
jgi:PadR family transcriptional regulator, regulatory protein PadR